MITLPTDNPFNIKNNGAAVLENSNLATALAVEVDEPPLSKRST